MNHKVVKPNTSKKHAVNVFNVRAIETESSSFYAGRTVQSSDNNLRRGGRWKGGGGRGGGGRGGGGGFPRSVVHLHLRKTALVLGL